MDRRTQNLINLYKKASRNLISFFEEVSHMDFTIPLASGKCLDNWAELHGINRMGKESDSKLRKRIRAKMQNPGDIKK